MAECSPRVLPCGTNTSTRKDHLLMNYAQTFDRLPIQEQEALACFWCNLFETSSASEWTLYISEWDAPGGGLPLSNIRVTTKVGGFCINNRTSVNTVS